MNTDGHWSPCSPSHGNKVTRPHSLNSAIATVTYLHGVQKAASGRLSEERT
jgi:hypothetical protein